MSSEAPSTAGKYIWILVVLIVLLSMFFLAGGSLQKTKDLTLFYLKKFVFQALNKEDKFQSTTKPPEYLKEAFDNFTKSLDNASSVGQCFDNPDIFSNLNGFRVVFGQGEDKKGYVKLLNKEGQIVGFKVMENVKPCVVTGTSYSNGQQKKRPATELFYEKIINKDNAFSNFQEYNEIDNIEINDDSHINFFGKEWDSKTGDLKVYKPDAGHICFFVTHNSWTGSCDYDDDSISQYCFEKIRRGMEYNQYYNCKDKEKKVGEETGKSNPAFDSFTNSLTAARDKGNCFLKYQRMPALGAFTMSIEQKKGSTSFTLTDPDNKVIKTQTIDGLRPCVVSGKGNIEHFYERYLGSGKIQGQDYADVNNMKLFGDGTITPGFLGLTRIPNNDNSLIYKPDKDHYCFFLTYTEGFRYCSVSESAIKDSCLNIIKDKMSKGEIATC